MIVFIILISICTNYANDEHTKGSIKGAIVDVETKLPIVGANIFIKDNVLGAASDITGFFEISNVPVGNYVLQIEYIGYQPITKTDVIVRSKRVTFLQVEMMASSLEADEIVIHAGYFQKDDEQANSSTEFSYEEIRRAPGSAGDVSRILMTLPSIAKVNDQSNNLIVRGGNPIENTFYIDNIEIPNINHFPNQGASGGPIGLVNVDFIQDVTFSSGGFPVLYGDKLSSIMDITFREGNHSEFDGQLDLNFAGFGGVAEGPLPKDKGSWLFSARRSYLDFVVDVFDVGSTVAPVYGDVQGKCVYDINSKNKLILLGIFADDHNSPGRETAEKNFMTHYGNQDLYQTTIGLNWRTIWGTKGYSNTSIAYTSNNYNEDFFETTTGNYSIKNRTHEQSFKFRNINHFRINVAHTVEFGMSSKYLMEDYNNWYASTTNDIGNSVPDLIMNEKIKGYKVGGFINYIYKPFSSLTTNLGVRSDYFSYNQNATISPRLSLSYQLTARNSINVSTGIFYQNLPLLLLAQNESNKNLKDIKAIHYILGFDHLLTESTKFTMEIYQKNYENFPMDAEQPSLFIIDKNYFENYGSFVDKGRALSRGIELTIQKKLAVNFYGLISASYFRSKYKNLNDKWINRDFDNRFTFSMEGGYKPSNKWEFSARWIFAGGVPCTSVDIEQSQETHQIVYDKNRINKNRYPAYHSMNVRFDRRFNLKNSNIVTYFSVWNVYNRKNVANYFWNDKEQKLDKVYQWGLLPIFGVEYEF